MEILILKSASSSFTNAGISTFASSNALTGFFTSPLLNKGTIYCRYCSNAELKAIKETGILRGGIPGRSYFTTDKYTTSAEAQERLSLGTLPEVRIEFSITNSPKIFGPSIVQADKIGHLGKGIEYWSPNKVDLIIRRIMTLK